jgi:hypothetical protein
MWSYHPPTKLSRFRASRVSESIIVVRIWLLVNMPSAIGFYAKRLT